MNDDYQISGKYRIVPYRLYFDQNTGKNYYLEYQTQNPKYLQDGQGQKYIKKQKIKRRGKSDRKHYKTKKYLKKSRKIHDNFLKNNKNVSQELLRSNAKNKLNRLLAETLVQQMETHLEQLIKDQPELKQKIKHHKQLLDGNILDQQQRTEHEKKLQWYDNQLKKNKLAIQNLNIKLGLVQNLQEQSDPRPQVFVQNMDQQQQAPSVNQQLNLPANRQYQDDFDVPSSYQQQTQIPQYLQQVQQVQEDEEDKQSQQSTNIGQTLMQYARQQIQQDPEQVQQITNNLKQNLKNKYQSYVSQVNTAMFKHNQLRDKQVIQGMQKFLNDAKTATSSRGAPQTIQQRIDIFEYQNKGKMAKLKDITEHPEWFSYDQQTGKMVNKKFQKGDQNFSDLKKYGQDTGFGENRHELKGIGAWRHELKGIGYNNFLDVEQQGMSIKDLRTMIETEFQIQNFNSYDMQFIVDNFEQINPLSENKEFKIIIFLKNHHYRVCVYDRMRDEIVYHDPLCLQKSLDNDIKQIQNFAKITSPETMIKLKINLNQWQKDEEYWGSSLCSLFVFYFIVNYAVCGQSFQQATLFNKNDKSAIQQYRKSGMPFI